MTIDINIDKLEERYFSGLTTEAEERVVKNWLLTHPDGHDELRAVMSYTVTGKTINSHRRNKKQSWARVAAVTGVIILSSALYHFVGMNSSAENICIAYVGGEKITNQDAVMAELRGSIDDAKPELSMEEQMSDIMGTFNEEDK